MTIHLLSILVFVNILLQIETIPVQMHFLPFYPAVLVTSKVDYWGVFFFFSNSGIVSFDLWPYQAASDVKEIVDQQKVQMVIKTVAPHVLYIIHFVVLREAAT